MTPAEKRIAVCPGSYDPITRGHLDVISRATMMIDEVVVAVTTGSVKKQPMFDAEERIAFVALEAAPAGLTVGELAEVTLHAAAAAPSLVLPNAAIKHTVAGTGVWLLREGKPAFAALTVGDSSLDGRVQVRDTLREGDVVIAHSERELTPDTRIRVVEQLAGGRS